ncbi:MAG TPA: hypothetical protein VGL56_13030 [Fimbriimonadaceae bacterium]|jgi:hypothetical protein
MEYFVIGPDGQQYGPASLATLETWAAENRIAPTSMLKDPSGQTVAAASVLRAFAPQPVAAPPAAASPAAIPPASAPGNPSPYLRPNVPNPNWSNPPGPYQQPRNTGADNALLMGVLMRCGLAIILCLVLRAAGLITAVYALIYAIQAKSRDHKHGNLLVGIAAATVVVVGIAFAYKLAHPTVY